MSTGGGNLPFFTRRQMVVRLLIPVSCKTSLQVSKSMWVMGFGLHQSCKKHEGGEMTQSQINACCRMTYWRPMIRKTRTQIRLKTAAGRSSNPVSVLMLCVVNIACKEQKRNKHIDLLDMRPRWTIWYVLRQSLFCCWNCPMQRFGRKLRFKACHLRESARETGVIGEILPCWFKVKLAGRFDHLNLIQRVYDGATACVAMQIVRGLQPKDRRKSVPVHRGLPCQAMCANHDQLRDGLPLIDKPKISSARVTPSPKKG